MDSGSRNSSDPIVNINVTPLVDVSLVLVIIFMIAAPLSMQSGIGVKTVKRETGNSTSTAQAPEVRAEIMIRLNGNQVSVNDQISDMAKLPYLLTGLLSQNKEKLVYITPGDDVEHGQLVGIMDLARQCGAQRLAIVDDPSGNSVTASLSARGAAPAVQTPLPGKASMP